MQLSAYSQKCVTGVSPLSGNEERSTLQHGEASTVIMPPNDQHLIQVSKLWYLPDKFIICRQEQDINLRYIDSEMDTHCVFIVAFTFILI